ncbi:MAG: hypothetical protein L0H64_05770 [Pseudonocardia sp.]|nr:hypothetical protein [Pseudonocardia sp.]
MVMVAGKGRVLVIEVPRDGGDRLSPAELSTTPGVCTRLLRLLVMQCATPRSRSRRGGGSQGR